MSATIVLLTKRDSWSQRAGTLCQILFGPSLNWEQGAPTDPLPKSVDLPKYDAIFSFLSPWIVPADMLTKATIALNFHPGSCDYPGTGCYNFALYEGAKKFGPVCHHMEASVDCGQVVSEILFPVFEEDTVETLKFRTMISMLEQFHQIASLVASGFPLPTHSRSWQRRPYTRKQLNALCETTPNMEAVEVARRIRATTYPGYPGPYLLRDGTKEFYPVPQRQALA